MEPHESSTSIWRSPFVSALLGGAIVAAVFGALVATGVIAGSTTTKNTVKTVSPSASQTQMMDSAGEGLTIQEIYKKDGDGVASIQATISEPVQTPFGFPQEEQGQAAGSGFVINDKGNLLTNAHVVENASAIKVKFGTSSQEYKATVAGMDKSHDIALLKVDAPKGKLHPLPLGDSSKVEVGDMVVAIGNPFGLDATVTSGIVSALQREIPGLGGFSINDVIQTDAPINPGNSGGPLINAEGQVIGINSQIQTGGGSAGNIGIGFAIPINTAKNIAKEIQTTGEAKTAWLGVEVQTIPDGFCDNFKIPCKGVLVGTATQGGPAAKAGIEGGNTRVTFEGRPYTIGGDVITKVDGKAVTQGSEVVSAVEQKDPGQKMTLTVVRAGKERTVTVTLGDRKDVPATGPGGSQGGDGGGGGGGGGGGLPFPGR